MEASRNISTEVAKLLVASGADSSEMSIKDWVSAGMLEKVKESIASGADTHSIQTYVNLKDEDDYYGDTALHVASQRGYSEIVKLLIASGADTHSIQTYVNLKNQDGRTALHNASSRGHLDIVKLLIDSGADINATDKYGGYTAMDYASEIFSDEGDQGIDIEYIEDLNKRCREVVEYLKSKGAKKE